MDPKGYLKKERRYEVVVGFEDGSGKNRGGVVVRMVEMHCMHVLNFQRINKNSILKIVIFFKEFCLK